MSLVGKSGVEMVEGIMEASGDEAVFAGRGTSVQPKGFLAVTPAYNFRGQGDEIFEANSGTLLHSTAFRPSLTLGQVPASCVPFIQQELAKRQGIELAGMLGQLPLHRDFALDVDHKAHRLAMYSPAVGSRVAAQLGLTRLPGINIQSGLMAVTLVRAKRLPGSRSNAVLAMVDSGAANSILNWPAAELLLGLRQGDRLVREAPMIQATGVGGGLVTMSLLTVSLGLGEDGVHLDPVRVAIGDADVFGELFGREESGSWWFGLGPQRQKPAAIIGQDILSQRRYVLSASEPAMYIAPDPAGHRSLEYVGQGDCLDEAGNRFDTWRLPGLTADAAAWQCLELHGCIGLVVGSGRDNGICYLLADPAHQSHEFQHKGFQRSHEGSARASRVARSSGQSGADCFRLPQ